MRVPAALAALVSSVLNLSAQGTPERIVSPEVRAGGVVTFRFAAPSAKQVSLALEGSDRLPMERNEAGVWTVTTSPLEPDYYGYSFVADGVSLLDPLNPSMKPNLIAPSSLVHVPGSSSLPWERSDVPRGTLHHHFHRSALAGDERDFFVYTPPGYDADAQHRYPVLYLLHGFSDDASAWTAVGRAHVILDNLIAQKKARPMLVVMPLGYGTMELVRGGWGRIGDVTLRRASYERFRDVLFTEVIPSVEKQYRVSPVRAHRAIAGLSMGGAESLFVGLNALDRFAWIGAFSSGGLEENYAAVYPGVDAGVNARLRLLWIACGTEDRLITINRSLRAWLTSKDVRHTAIETPGGHTWMVWRRNLAAFAPLLFAES